MGALDVNDVESDIPRANGCRDPVSLHSPDIVDVHLLRSRTDWVDRVGDLRGPDGRPAGLASVGDHPLVMEFDARECAVAVSRFAHDREVARIVVVPKPGGYERHRV